MKNTIKFYMLTFLFVASPLFAVEGIAVINLQEAILETQTANDAFKALDEDPDFSGNMEQAQTIQADMQAIAEKLQKEQETLSQEEIQEMQKEYQEKSQDLEFIAGKIQQARQETAQKIMMELGQAATSITRELMSAKQIKLLLERPARGQQSTSAVLDFDAELDITDDVTSMLDVVAAEATAEPTE